MPSNEDLYRELEQQELEEDRRFGQGFAMKAIRRPVPPKREDPATARKRFEKEIKPVLEMRRRIEAGLPPTTNPLKNLYLKITGQDKIVYRDDFKIVDPTKGLVVEGKTIEDVQREIAEHPEEFAHLMRKPAEAQKTDAPRRSVDDLKREAEQRSE